ncbi:MAG: hypothetical protein WBQ86_12715 [Candidatus Binatus sp.]
MNKVLFVLLATLIVPLSGCAEVGVGYSCQKPMKESQSNVPQGFECGWNYGAGAGLGIVI